MINKRIRAIRDEVQAIKQKAGCSKCGYNKSAAALAFHHVDRKTKRHDVSRMAAQGRALVSIKEEISKCVVLCMNCHAELEEALSNSG